MFSQWGLVETGNMEQGTSQSSEARRPTGPPEAKFAAKIFFGGGESLREQGTGNREQGTCRVPQVFPEHLTEPLRENQSLRFLAHSGGKLLPERVLFLETKQHSQISNASFCQRDRENVF